METKTTEPLGAGFRNMLQIIVGQMRPQVAPTCSCTFQRCIAFTQGPCNAWAGDRRIPEGGLLSGLQRRINHHPEMLIPSSRTGPGSVTHQMEPRAHCIGI